ncbi:MAG: hypothetical protein ACI9LN_001747 [Saprospiraceae bacterium]|jgi:hypothetical protein
MVQLIKSFLLKECELNELRLLRGYFALIFHFKNAHYININRTFKERRKNKTSLPRIYTYLFLIPK